MKTEYMTPNTVPQMSNADLQKAIDSLLTYFTSENVDRMDLEEQPEGIALDHLLDEQTRRAQLWREPEPAIFKPSASAT